MKRAPATFDFQEYDMSEKDTMFLVSFRGLIFQPGYGSATENTCRTFLKNFQEESK